VQVRLSIDGQILLVVLLLLALLEWQKFYSSVAEAAVVLTEQVAVGAVEYFTTLRNIYLQEL
jgi:hypothetical protein